MGHPRVTIVNSTPYDAQGNVHYASQVCPDNKYSVLGNGATWTGPDRGLCLVTRISATLRTPQGDVEAAAYTSSGTAYSQYAIIYQANNKGFTVTRVASAEMRETKLAKDGAVSVEPEAEPKDGTAEPQCPHEQATSK